jgi:integrase
VYDTRAEAEAAEMEVLASFRISGKASAPKAHKSVTLKTVYERACLMQWRSKGEKPRATAQHIVQTYWGWSTSPTDITEDDVLKFIKHCEDQGNAAATVNRKLSALSVLLSQGVDADWYSETSLVRLKRYKQHEAQPRDRILSLEEERSYFKSLEGMDTVCRDYFTLLFDTGARRMEVCNLKVRDVDTERYIVQFRRKGGKITAVPLTDRAIALLKERMAGRQSHEKVFVGLTDNRIRTHFKHLKGIMKLDYDETFVVHTIRHTAATRMLEAGNDLQVVSWWLGHANTLITARYLKLVSGMMDSGRAKMNERTRMMNDHL